MPRPKKGIVNVYPRLTIPKDAWARVEQLAAMLGLEPAVLARVLMSVSLVQWESIYLHPERYLQSHQQMEDDVVERTRGLVPDLIGADGKVSG